MRRRRVRRTCPGTASPIGPKRRTREELVGLFAPELREVAYSEEVMTGIDFPFGPTVLGVRLWLQRS